MIISLKNPIAFQHKFDESRKKRYNVQKNQPETVVDISNRNIHKARKHMILYFIKTIKLSIEAKKKENAAKMEAKKYTQYFKSENMKKLQNSPVSYIVSACQNFLDGNATQEEFSSDFIEKTEKTRFIFAHMSKKDIVANQQIFKNELTLADKLYRLISEKKLTKEQLINEIEEYNKKN